MEEYNAVNEFSLAVAESENGAVPPTCVLLSALACEVLSPASWAELNVPAWLVVVTGVTFVPSCPPITIDAAFCQARPAVAWGVVADDDWRFLGVVTIGGTNIPP